MAITPSELRRQLSPEDALDGKITYLLQQGASEVDGKWSYKASGFAGTPANVIAEVIRRFMIAGWHVDYTGDTLIFNEM